MRNKEGYTLIEVVISLLIVVIATTSILVVMAKLVNLTGRGGATIEISRATAIAQQILDEYKYGEYEDTGTKYPRNFPPVKYFPGSPFSNASGSVSYSSGPGLAPNESYAYEVVIRAPDRDAPASGLLTPIATDEYGTSITGKVSHDSLFITGPDRNIFKIMVRVYRGTIASGKPLVTVSTYRVRNGYY
ncbi:MAG: type II secretion system protein [Candidatus Omnitrophota bacterium]